MRRSSATRRPTRRSISTASTPPTSSRSWQRWPSAVPSRSMRCRSSGIRAVSALDIAFATELGYRIELLGIGGHVAAGIEAWLSLHGAAIRTDRAGGWRVQRRRGGGRLRRPRHAGRPAGPGEGPTASAVVADLIDIARNRHTPVWVPRFGELSNAPFVPMSTSARITCA